jgi:probable rRNA maturation factor
MSIEVLNESGLEVDVRRTHRLAAFVMDRMRVHPQAELCITAVDEETIAELNAKWMEKDGPTDVLAFPMDELRPGRVNEEPEEGVLGDLVLCPAVAARQAGDAGHTTTDELDLLTVHGILHLLGYDHAEPEEHQEMFALQARLLGEWLGTPEARTPRPTTGDAVDEAASGAADEVAGPEPGGGATE